MPVHACQHQVHHHTPKQITDSEQHLSKFRITGGFFFKEIKQFYNSKNVGGSQKLSNRFFFHHFTKRTKQQCLYLSILCNVSWFSPFPSSIKLRHSCPWTTVLSIQNFLACTSGSKALSVKGNNF